MFTFYIDGIGFTFPAKVKRKIEKRTSDVAGYLMTGHYNNDLLGSYPAYTVTLTIPPSKEQEYTTLFDLLARPKKEYDFTLPYNQEFITFNGRVNVISDDYYDEIVNIEGRLVKYWRGTTFEVISNDPIYQSSGEE